MAKSKMMPTFFKLIMSAIALILGLSLQGCSDSSSSSTTSKPEACMGVTDVAGFKDAFNWSCWNWIGWDCTAATYIDSRYTQADEDAIIKNCPASCGTCNEAVNVTFQGSYSTVVGASGADAFLKECTKAISPALCLVVAPDIVVTMGAKDNETLQAAVDKVTSGGLTLAAPFSTTLNVDTGVLPTSAQSVHRRRNTEFEEHRRRVSASPHRRRAGSVPSPPPATATATITATTTTTTDCSSLTDNLAFRDAFGWACFTWIGWDCSAATYLTPNYTQAQENEVLNNCALSCSQIGDVACQFAQNLTMNQTYSDVVTNKTLFMQQCSAAVAPAYCLEVSSASSSTPVVFSASGSGSIALSVGARSNATLQAQISTIQASGIQIGSSALGVQTAESTSVHRRRTPSNEQFEVHRRRAADSPHRRRTS